MYENIGVRNYYFKLKIQGFFNFEFAILTFLINVLSKFFFILH